jgi:hypothetical protein
MVTNSSRPGGAFVDGCAEGVCRRASARIDYPIPQTLAVCPRHPRLRRLATEDSHASASRESRSQSESSERALSRGDTGGNCVPQGRPPSPATILPAGNFVALEGGDETNLLLPPPG